MGQDPDYKRKCLSNLGCVVIRRQIKKRYKGSQICEDLSESGEEVWGVKRLRHCPVTSQNRSRTDGKVTEKQTLKRIS